MTRLAFSRHEALGSGPSTKQQRQKQPPKRLFLHLGLRTISQEGKWPKRNPQRKGGWRKAPGVRGRGVRWGVRVGVVLEAVLSSPEKAK